VLEQMRARRLRGTTDGSRLSIGSMGGGLIKNRDNGISGIQACPTCVCLRHERGRLLIVVVLELGAGASVLERRLLRYAKEILRWGELGRIRCGEHPGALAFV
jgi:hypothetical protein